MKRLLLRPFIKGSMVLLPLLVTVWLVWSVLSSLNDLGVQVLQLLHADLLLFPGMGVIVMLLLLLVVGLAFQLNPISWVYEYVEDTFLRMPVVKTLYGAVKDFAAMFDGEKPQAQQVVLVDMPNLGKIVGFVTTKSIPKPMQALDGDYSNLVAVYFPMSYMVGGYTLFLPQDRLTHVDWSVEDAMRFAITAGISQSQARKPHAPAQAEEAAPTAAQPIVTEEPKAT